MNFRSAAEDTSPPGTPLSPESAEAAATERLLLASLPPGWSVIARCRFGTAVPGPRATGCHALAHPAVGIALIDIAPDATPNAESRLRRALGAAEFWPDFPGNLPVWHGRLDSAAIRDLDDMLQVRFSVLPPLTVPGGQAWISAVRQALGQDQAWEVPGQASRPAAPAPPLDLDEPEEEPQRRGWMRSLPLLALGFLATFGLGLAAGLVLLPLPEPAEQPATPALSQRVAPAEAAPAIPPEPVAAEPAAQPPAEAEPTPAPVTSTATAEPDPPPVAAAMATPEPAEATAPLPRDDGADALAAPEMPASEPLQSVAAGSDAPPMPAEAPEEPELPPAPPPTPPAPALHTTAPASRPPGRPASGIDRACSLALFRFQQGETLSAADQAYVRNGCMTRR